MVMHIGLFGRSYFRTSCNRAEEGVGIIIDKNDIRWINCGRMIFRSKEVQLTVRQTFSLLSQGSFRLDSLVWGSMLVLHSTNSKQKLLYIVPCLSFADMQRFPETPRLVAIHRFLKKEDTLSQRGRFCIGQRRQNYRPDPNMLRTNPFRIADASD